MTQPPIRVLYINLSDQTSEVKAHSDLAGYFGGLGVSTKLLLEHLDEDPFILATGPFCGLFPACSQTAASFISPLTGNLGESLAGGKLGLCLKGVGIDGVIVSGKAREPRIVVVGSDGVSFVSATSWGSGSFEVLNILEKEYPGASISVIGPAAENGVRFSSVLVDRFFHFRRMGLGALWGRKKLKGLVVLEGERPPLPATEPFSKVYDEVSVQLADPRPEGLKLGIQKKSEKIWLLEASSGGLPALNFTPLDGEHLTGSDYEDLGRKAFSSMKGVGCGDCPVECWGVGNCEGIEISVDFESLASLGPLLGLNDVNEVLSLLYLACDLGMDPVSLGVSLAFLTEKEGWSFGDVGSYKSLVSAIAEKEEVWAKELSLGLRGAARRKGKDSAMVLSSLAALPYFNGYLTIVSQITMPARGLLASGAHLLDISFAGEDVSDEDKIRRLLVEDRRGLLLSFLAACPWVRKVYDLPQVFSCVESLGWGWSHEGLETLTAKIYNLRWEIKEKLGFSWEDIKIPERVFELESATGYLERERLERMIEMYRDNIGT